MRNSLNYLVWNKCEDMVADLKRVNTASKVDEAEQYWLNFKQRGWCFPFNCSILAKQQGAATPSFDYLPEIRKIIYTTIAIVPV